MPAEALVESTNSTPSLTPFQQAAADAKAQHSSSDESAAEATSSTGQAETPQQDPAVSADVAATETQPDDLAFPTLEALSAQHKDPKKLYKELQKVFTQKTQKLSEARKQVEPFMELVQRYQDDPKSVLEELAAEQGITLAPQPTSPAASAAVDDWMADFKTALGPDLEFLAEKLADPLKGLAEKIAKQTIEERVGPLQSKTEQLVSKAAMEAVNSTLDSFGKSHPDWKQHEMKMHEIGQKLLPANNMSQSEYLEMLYSLATRNVAAGSAAAKAVEKMTKAAQESDRGSAVPAEQVRHSPPKGATFKDAAAAARRGEVWQH